VFIEVPFLAGSEVELDAGIHLQVLVKLQDPVANAVEGLVKAVSVLVLGEGVLPFKPEIQVVEDEAAEKAVLRVRYQCRNLPGRSREYGGELGLQQLHELAVLSPGVGDGLVVESFPEAVAVVPEVGLEGDGQCVALGLEHQSTAIILGQNLVYHRRAGVGRDDECPAFGLLRRFKGWVTFLLPFIVGLGFSVLGHVLVVEELHLLLDGLDQAPAEREPSLAGGCRRRHKKEEVWEYWTVAVYAGQVGKASGEGHYGAQDEKICIFIRDGVTYNLVQKLRQFALQVLRECRHPFFPQTLITLNPSRGGLLWLRDWSFRPQLDTCKLGKIEERPRLDAVTLRAHTLVILLVGLIFIIAGVELGEAVEVTAPVFAQGLLQRKSNLQPLVIVAGDIHLPCLHRLHQTLNLIDQVFVATSVPSVIQSAHPVILSAAKDLLFPGLLPVTRIKRLLAHGCILLSSFKYAFGS